MMRLYCGRVIGGSTRRSAQINGLYYQQKRQSVCRSSSVNAFSEKGFLDSAGDSCRGIAHRTNFGTKTPGACVFA
jgi:hypothetical protein